MFTDEVQANIKWLRRGDGPGGEFVQSHRRRGSQRRHPAQGSLTAFGEPLAT